MNFTRSHLLMALPEAALTATLVCLVLVAGAIASARASEPCPSSTFFYSFHFQSTTTPVYASAFDTTVVNADGDTTRVAFDHQAATLSVHAIGRVWAGGRVIETWNVAGVAPGTVLPVEIQFPVDCYVLNNCGGGGCGVRFFATILAGADSIVGDASRLGPCDSCSTHLVTTLSLPVTITAGVPLEVAFSMLYAVTNVAWGRADATGSYRIAGLPPGAELVRCIDGITVPVRRVTWGGLKSAYR